METRIEKIIQSLTLEEKISLLAGKDFWETVPVQSKGVPAIKVTSSQSSVFALKTYSRRRLTVPMALAVPPSQTAQELHAFLRLSAPHLPGTLACPTA